MPALTRRSSDVPLRVAFRTAPQCLVMTYLASVLRSVVAIDRTRLRGWSAVRRGILVVVTFLVFTWWFGPDIGALASVASLFVGLQDRSDPPGYTSRLMAVQSAVLAIAVVLGGFFSPWVGSAVLIVSAFLSGVIAQHDKSVSRMFSDVLQVSAFLGLSSMARPELLKAAFAVLVAGLAQAVMIRATARWSSDLPERRPVAAALVAVADHLDDAALRSKTTTGPASEKAITDADAAVATSDLSHARRRALRKLLGDAEVLRQEASAIRVRNAFEVAQIQDPEVDAARDLASLTLRAAARAMTALPRPGLPDKARDQALAEIDEYAGVAENLAKDKDVRPTARSIARQSLRIGRHVNRLLDAKETRVSKRALPVGENVVDEVLHPGPRDLRGGLRLAAAAAIGLGLAAMFNLPHGAWVAATAVALLRPDYRALTSDTVARAMGVTIGAASVVPLVFLTGRMDFADVLLLLVMSCAAFAVTSANEGLFVIAITLQTVYTRAMVGEDPVHVAQTRLLDVLLGCLIAVILLLALPLRQGRILAREMAEYSAATADWLQLVSRRAAGEKPAGMKKARRRMRQCRVAVQHGLDLRKLEPLGAGMSAWRGQTVFARIHDCARAGTAAVLSLGHGATTSELGERAAEHASTTLEVTAHVLRHRQAKEVDPLSGLPEQPADDIAELLLRADQEAQSALHAASAASTDLPAKQ